MDLRLALDLDGCLVDWNRTTQEMLAEVAGLDKQPYIDPPCWAYHREFGYTDAQFAEVLRRQHTDKTFWSTLPPLPGAVKFLDWLWRAVSSANWRHGTAHEVYFLTDRPGTNAKNQSEIWLMRHGYSGLPATVLICQEKGAIVRDLRITHMLDDKPEHLWAAGAANATAERFLRRATYNDADHRSFHSVADVTEFQALIAPYLEK